MGEQLHIQNYVGGKFYATPQTLANMEPALGKSYGLLARSNADDASKAVAAAKAAQKSWATRGYEERAKWLEKIANGIEERFERFAQAEARDCGKPIVLARRMDIARAVANFRFFA